MDASEIIEKAADYMEAHGKATGWYETDDGAVCVVGALRKFGWCTFYRERVLFVLANLMGEFNPEDDTMCWHSIISKFSDDHDQVEVIETMRKAAHFARLEETTS